MGFCLVLGGNQLGPHPGCERRGNVFLKKEIVIDAIGVALERERAVLEIRQQQIGDGVVEIQEVPLGIAVGGEINLVQVGELQVAAIDGHRHFGLLAGEQGRARGRRGSIFNGIVGGRQFPFPHAFFGTYVGPQAEKYGRAQMSVLGPIGELDLTDQFRTNPNRSAQHRLFFGERRARRHEWR